MNENDEIKVNEKKVKTLIRRIIIAERNNIKSEEKNDTQMVNAIKKMIKEEVECL